MPASNAGWVAPSPMRQRKDGGDSCTLSTHPTPCPVPWSKSSPSRHRGIRASASRFSPHTPLGNRAMASWICPRSTSVAICRSRAVMSPSAKVRVTSVVPQR